ncbi:hypothetical protein ACT3CE_03365 [Marinifilum sp. RC60d5]|uniref:hypothetical protein n=1 Tax=Marinifilum sp. RC60d5 TaxID=3458414 RepID=UPI0040373E1E
MRQRIVIFCFLLFSFSVSGQSKFDPKVIVLLPQSVVIEKGLEEKIDFYEKYGVAYQKNYLIEKRDSLISVIMENDSISPNYKEHYKNQIDFANELNFVNNILWSYTGSFHTILDLDFDNSLVVVGKQKSLTDFELMQEYSKNNDADYLINVDSLIVTKYKRDILVRPVFTIYYSYENKTIKIDPWKYDQLNKSYLTVGKKTLNIYFDDIDARTKILNIIKGNGNARKREELKIQKNIEKQRKQILDSLFQNGKSVKKLEGFDKDSILNTSISNLYTTIYSADKDKYLSFFVFKKKWNYDGFGGVNDAISVIYCKKEESNWEAEYQQYCVIKLKKLTQEEHIKTSFMNLIDMDFFKENSIELNKEFWSKELFKQSNKNFK